MNRRKLTDEALGMIASRFKLLGEANRLRIIIALEEGEMSVNQIVEATGMTQANASRHLSSLTVGGILRRRKEGMKVYYKIDDPSIFEMCESVCGNLKKRLGAQAKIMG